MKKLTLLGVGLMLGALSFTGCQKEVNTGNIGEVRSQKLTIISSTAETRTVMEGDKATGFNTAWTEASDKLGVYTYNAEAAAGALTMNSEFGITSITDGAATFEGDIDFDSADRTYDLYAYYPRNAANDDTNSSQTSVAAVIPGSQTMPENGTYDPAGDYMVALPGQTVAVSGGTILTASVDDFQFRYLTGFINLAVADITAAGITSGDIVESVKISAGGASTPVLSGAFSLNLTDGAMTFSSESNEVTVTCPAGLTLGGLDLWAVVNPFALTDAADEITFIVETATHTIEKSIAVAQLGGNFAIAAGGIKTFGMTIDDSCTITEKPLDQGTDGNISWVLSANGTLTFSGTGDMRADYHPMNPTAGVPKWLTPANAAATTKVVFESGITSIASYCLGGSTTNVLKNVAEIVIPSTVTTINDNYALGGATAITSLTLPSSVETIGTNAFDGCTGLVSLTLQEGLITIKNNAFKGTKLVTLTIPNSVTSIGNLGGITTLESATLGTGLTTLGANAFQKSTALRAITIPANITAIGNYAFDGCTVLATVNMPSGLLTIGNYAFRACPAIENITLPSTLTSLGTYVFQNCTQLKGIVIPDSVPTIGNYAFSGCSALESATIGSGVTAINTNAFASCTNLGNVTVLATVPPTLNTSNNFNVNTNDTLTVLAGTLAAYQAATAWANAFTTIVEAQ